MFSEYTKEMGTLYVIVRNHEEDTDTIFWKHQGVLNERNDEWTKVNIYISLTQQYQVTLQVLEF